MLVARGGSGPPGCKPARMTNPSTAAAFVAFQVEARPHARLGGKWLQYSAPLPASVSCSEFTPRSRRDPTGR